MDSVRAAEPLFSYGLNLANLVVSSDVLCNSWAAISELQSQIDRNHQSQSPSSSETVQIREFLHPDYKIIAFVTPPVATSYLQEEGDLVPFSSSEASEFQFLCSEDNPSFAINKAALSLFNSLRDNKLSPLKAQVATSSKSVPHIITGDRLGGSIASLFTLWLLSTLDLGTKNRPLCITFGSPLIGDVGFQQAVSQYSTWSSTFLHVAYMDDCFPRFFLLSTTEQSLYKPFGTFLLCSQSGGACFEAPDTITELLTRMGRERNGGTADSQIFNYRDLIECLEWRLICKNHSAFSMPDADSFKAGINAQVGVISLMQIQNMDIDALWRKVVISEKKILERKNQALDPAKEFYRMEENLALVEWYKNKCGEDGQGSGYYDSFKNKMYKRDHSMVRIKKTLDMYWKAVVEEVEKRPQLAEEPMWIHLLFAGTNYRRMVEPLHIAEYYHFGQRHYLSQGRSKHFKLLEQWLDEHQKQPQNSVPNNWKIKNNRCYRVHVEDARISCFRAHVEDARISCRLLNSRVSNSTEIENLVRFEEYVINLFKNYEFSPDFFLESSSYMQWWREYEEILEKQMMGASYNSQLALFMMHVDCDQYILGTLVLSRHE